MSQHEHRADSAFAVRVRGTDGVRARLGRVAVRGLGRGLVVRRERDVTANRNCGNQQDLGAYRDVHSTDSLRTKTTNRTSAFTSVSPTAFRSMRSLSSPAEGTAVSVLLMKLRTLGYSAFKGNSSS